MDLKNDDKNIIKVCKKLLEFSVDTGIEKIHNEISTVQTKILTFKHVINFIYIYKKYTEDQIKKETPKFVMTRGAIKAIELLNDKIYLQIFKYEVIPSDDIINIYKILFNFLNKKEITNIKDNMLFWKEVCDLFNLESVGKIGDFINQNSTNLNFSSENIYLISRIIGSDLSKMTAPNYTKICPTTGLVFFFINDALEYSGIIIDKKTPPVKILNLLDFTLENLLSKEIRLKSFLNKLSHQ